VPHPKIWRECPECKGVRGRLRQHPKDSSRVWLPCECCKGQGSVEITVTIPED
jgi:hypothetical protein